jgi:rod shape-determining protein MreC
VGDLLVTSGLGGRFPRGYPVGEISVVERDPGRPFATVQAMPSVQLDRSLEVLLVNRRQGPEPEVATAGDGGEAAGAAPPDDTAGAR